MADTILSSQNYIYKNLDLGKDVIYARDINIRYPMWSNNVELMSNSTESILRNFYTKESELNPKSNWESFYYLNVYDQTSSLDSNPNLLFSVGCGTYTAFTCSIISSSYEYNSSYLYSYPMNTVYRQMINFLENGKETTFFDLPYTTGSNTLKSTIKTIMPIIFNRDMCGNIDVNNFLLILSGSGRTVYDDAGSPNTDEYPSFHRMHITAYTGSTYNDKYLLISSMSVTTSFNDGISYITSSVNNPIGWIYPQKGCIILDSNKIDGLIGYATNPTIIGPFGIYISSLPNYINPNSIIKESINWMTNGKYFQLYSNKTVKTSQYFCRVTANEYLNSTNPTWVSGSNNEIRDTLSSDKKTYITSVGLYDGDINGGNLIAIAKLSRPVLKDKNSALTIKVQLDF